MTVFPVLSDIYAARQRTAGLVRRTPLIPSERLSGLVGSKVHLKLESLQATGTFKARGAANKLLSLSAEERSRGVIAFSTGNHGRAVAHVGRVLGIGVTVCLSERVPAFRREAMRALGAEVVVKGSSQDEAYEIALRLQRDRGLTMVAPFDDPMVLCGQGTLALEILEDLPEVGTVVIPLSGGGLFAGTALALKSADPSIKTVGVSMEVAPAMIASLKAGRPVEIPEVDSLADALLGGIGLDNRYTFELTRRSIDQALTVSEAQIARAMVWALRASVFAWRAPGPWAWPPSSPAFWKPPPSPRAARSWWCAAAATSIWIFCSSWQARTLPSPEDLGLP